MSQTYLCNVETGKADPSLSTLKRLAEALGVTVSELVKEPKPSRARRS
jgi:transcriptional regulator with XRE-family HTH domain